MTVYLDGAEYAAWAVPLPGMNSASMIGGDAEAGSSAEAAGDAGFKGELDELEISKVARSLGFIKLAAVSEGGDKAASALGFGEEEGTSSWMSGGYFGVIIKNLSLDGWVVIGILAMMACISWYVMVTKVSYLNAIGAGNELFMKEWKHIASDLTVLDDREAEADMVKTMESRVDKAGQRTMRKAPLYRIYHLGVEEIRHRMVADKCSGERNGLAGRSIQAIRATLDGGLVRETQRINSKIVLLTICISGGPFLGLLGTVVGVMITFAAVAAAGEVNVNAIAPGIAAALLATVAGLSVAIPSLFGYNYILTRVKESTSDMHVFIDEFVTRMAEFYRE
jgi:biopolymer transport protein ExbB